jgi:hypothetical protein
MYSACRYVGKLIRMLLIPTTGKGIVAPAARQPIYGAFNWAGKFHEGYEITCMTINQSKTHPLLSISNH